MRFAPAALLALAACNTTGRTAPVEPDLEQRLELVPLIDGKTTKEEILLAYGIPAAHFEGERILTYRLEWTETGVLSVAPEIGADDGRLPYWRLSSISLVLVFDENHVLKKHTSLRVR